MIIASAAAGAPIRPSRVEVSLVHLASGRQRVILAMLHKRLVEHAAIGQQAAHHKAVHDGSGAVGKSDAPASAIMPSSAMALPWRPVVAAPYRNRRAPSMRVARRLRESIMLASSITGLASGSATMLVMPPAAAA
ncbi:MAG: hypothetical protein CM15mP115_02200 [Alphaproteobacteria bacterium]|nr:MAG: hypothetical protein CM15mP115_02200 [Alphaproteobacteria bacterium]